MPVHTVTIDAVGVITHRCPVLSGDYRVGWSKVRYDSVADLPDEIKYRIYMLDAARNDKGVADLKPLGTTRLRRDGGTHYEMYLKKS